MSCCNKTSNDLHYTAKRGVVRASHVTAKQQEVTLEQPLLADGARPRTGWGVKINIRGAEMEIKGTRATEVFMKAWSLLQKNSMAVTKATLWLNLNLQWLSNTREKDRLVSIEDLMAVSEIGQPDDTKRKTKLVVAELVKRFIETSHTLVESGMNSQNIVNALRSYEQATLPHNAVTGDAKVHDAIRKALNNLEANSFTTSSASWYQNHCTKMAKQFGVESPPPITK